MALEQTDSRESIFSGSNKSPLEDLSLRKRESVSKSRELMTSVSARKLLMKSQLRSQLRSQLKSQLRSQPKSQQKSQLRNLLKTTSRLRTTPYKTMLKFESHQVSNKTADPTNKSK